MADEVQAAIYCRISLAGLGDTTKTDDQERICRELAHHRGWHVAGVYTDHARSAWQQNRKRPAWDNMLADIKAGKITAIVVYHGDRLLRTHEDLLALIHLSRTRGIQLASPAGTRDLGNYDDQFILEIEASMAKRESGNTSRRRKQQYARWRRDGRVRPGGRGGRAFGFATDGLTHIPAEVAVVREVAERILAGEGTLAITRNLNARGVLTTSGTPMGHWSLRKMMARPRYAGLMPDGVSKAAWNPVLEVDAWQAVCAVLELKRGQHAYATGARKHLLSGIAVCGVCGSTLQQRQSKGGKQHGYGCVQPGCRKVYRSMELLDAYVSRRVVNLLAHPANPPAHRMAATGLAVQFQALQAQRAEAAAQASDPDHPHLDLILERLERIDERIAELRQLAEGDARARLASTHTGITPAGWDGLPLATRRALVSACYQVTVLPASKRGPGFRTEDVVLSPLASTHTGIISAEWDGLPLATRRAIADMIRPPR